MEISGTINQILMQLLKAALDPTKVFVCEVREYRAKRSLNANRYYRQLVRKLAQWSGMSEIHIHNDMIEHYGVEEEMDGEPVIMPLLEHIDYKELPYVHLKWTGDLPYVKNGKLYMDYIVMRGSRYYDAKQFSRLVDGLIQTIIGSNAPIEIMTPAELSSLKGYAA